MAEFRPAPFPFLSGISLEEGKITPPMDCTIYGQLIGSLLSLNHSQTDIHHAVNAISIYMKKPHEIHWNAAKRILQYIQGTRTCDIHYAADSKLELVGYTNFDWLGDSIDQNF